MMRSGRIPLEPAVTFFAEGNWLASLRRVINLSETRIKQSRPILRTAIYLAHTVKSLVTQ